MNPVPEPSIWSCRRFLRAGLMGLAVTMPVVTRAQVQVAAPTRSTTLGRELVSFGFGTSAGVALPPFVTRVRPHDGEPETRPDGYMQMVVRNGQPMLKASGQVALLVTLPEALPADFTIELDIVPKPCCNPEDISIEGTSAIDRGAASALVAWRHDGLSIHGGGFIRPYAAEMPKALDGQLVGNLTRIVFEFQGDQLRVFTNGIQHPDPPPTKFERRNKVLRVLVGGDVNGAGRDVYLARMRVVANSPTVAAAPNAGLFAPPPPRTITLADVAASGTRLTPRIVSLPAFAATGLSSSLPSRTIRLNAVASVGSSGLTTSRTISLPSYAAVGTTPAGRGATGRGGRGSAILVQRTIKLPPHAASGSGSRAASRTLLQPAFAAAGSASQLAARTIQLAAVNAIGAARLLTPRSISLAGWTAAGSSKTP
jgi:hypothetical protein